MGVSVKPNLNSTKAAMSCVELCRSGKILLDEKAFLTAAGKISVEDYQVARRMILDAGLPLPELNMKADREAIGPNGPVMRAVSKEL